MEPSDSLAEQARRKQDLALSLDRDRAALVIAHPFVGFLAMHLDIVPVFDHRVPTAGTDGHRIYANPDFFDTLGPGEREFVLAHEVWHCALRHIERRGDREPELWNVAIDLEVNRLLVDEGMTPPHDVLLDDLQTNAEERYDRLEFERATLPHRIEAFEEERQEQRRQHEARIEAGESEFYSHYADNGSEDGYYDEYGSHHERPTDVAVNERGRLADTHIEGALAPHEADEPTDRPTDPDFQPRGDRIGEEVWARRIQIAAQQVELRGGTIPGHLRWEIEKLRRPKVDWREVLRQFVTRRIGGERRWLPPARRSLHRGLYLPSRAGELLCLTVALDTSASCVDFAPTLFGELDGIVRAFGRYEIELILCDAEIQSVEQYGPQRPLQAATLAPAGGGGTSFVPVFDHYAGQPPPDALVYLTDGYGTVPDTAPPYPVLWAILDRWHEERRRGTAPFDPLGSFRTMCDWGQVVAIPVDS